jgi:hypothetical protein
MNNITNSARQAAEEETDKVAELKTPKRKTLAVFSRSDVSVPIGMVEDEPNVQNESASSSSSGNNGINEGLGKSQSPTPMSASPVISSKNRMPCGSVSWVSYAVVGGGNAGTLSIIVEKGESQMSVK